MRRLALAAVLVAVWLLLWDSVSAVRIVSGVVVAVLLLVLLPSAGDETDGFLPIRPMAALHLLVWFLWQFLISILQVVRAALLPGRWVRPGVVGVPLRTSSATLTALVSNITALTPGMQPVDGTPSPPFTIHIHVLTLTSEQQVHSIVHRLEDLVLAAFGRPGDRDVLAVGTDSDERAEAAGGSDDGSEESPR